MFRDSRLSAESLIVLAVVVLIMLLAVVRIHGWIQMDSLFAQMKATIMSSLTESLRARLETQVEVILDYASSRASPIGPLARQRVRRVASRAQELAVAQSLSGGPHRSPENELSGLRYELAATSHDDLPAHAFVFLPERSELLFPLGVAAPIEEGNARSALLSWLSDLAAGKGSGLLEYPTLQLPIDRGVVAYALPVTAQGWLVGAVETLVDEQSRAQGEVAALVEARQAEGHEELWLLDEKMGRVIVPPVDPAALKPSLSRNALRAVRSAVLEKGSFYGYSPDSASDHGRPAPLGTDVQAESLVCWQLIPEWNWVIGAGAPAEHSATVAARLSSRLDAELRALKLVVILPTLLVLLIAVTLVLHLHRRSVGATRAFALGIEQAVFDHTPINLSTMKLRNFHRVGERINQILAERKEAAERLRKRDAELLPAQMALMHLKSRGASEREHASIEEIHHSAMRAAGLTHQLLAFSRKEPFQLVPLSLNILVGSMESMIRPIIGEDVVLELALDKSIGLIEADRSQMEQVILNLVVNARDAMPAGGDLRISTRSVPFEPDLFTGEPASDRLPHVALEISDTGIGMEEEIQRRIFEPFFTTKEKGTGLGLSTVYAIVSRTGGRISVSSEPGRGTTFRLLFPQVRTVSREEQGDHVEEDLVGGSETILVVEDDRNVHGLIASLLRGVGYTILEAPDGRRALRLLRGGRRIDMILSDIVMPELSGDKLIEELPEEHRATPVLLMSGHPGLGGHLVVEKPFSPAVICARVRETLDGRPVRVRSGEERKPNGHETGAN